MSCTWGNTDCQNENLKCNLCFSNNFHYIPKKVKKKPVLSHRQQKADGRMGSTFEFKNHLNNTAILSDVSSRMTPNSGAGKIKGDEEIQGIINVMEELKTKVTTQASGKRTFTIKKDWLDKLHREATTVNKEFWYLKFCFHEDEDDVYVIVEQDVIMSFVKTIVEDRKTAITEKLRADLAEKMRRKTETELLNSKAEIDVLKAKLALLKHKKE